MYRFSLEKYPSTVYPKDMVKTIGILRKDHSEAWVTHFWEGFIPKLPSRQSNGSLLVSSQYELARISGMLDLRPYNPKFGFSKKMASLSIGGFHSFLGNSLKESGLESSDITALRTLVDINGGLMHTNPTFLLFSDYLLPVYMKLRAAGLSHYDLTGWKEKRIARDRRPKIITEHKPFITKYIKIAS